MINTTVIDLFFAIIISVVCIAAITLLLLLYSKAKNKSIYDRILEDKEQMEFLKR